MIRRPPRLTRTTTLFPHTTLFRADVDRRTQGRQGRQVSATEPTKRPALRGPFSLAPSRASGQIPPQAQTGRTIFAIARQFGEHRVPETAIPPPRRVIALSHLEWTTVITQLPPPPFGPPPPP